MNLIRKHSLAVAVSTALIGMNAVQAQSTLDVTSLDGTNGFVINGVVTSGRSGYSVSSAGDFNGDGFADVIIGARDIGAGTPTGNESYVVFGSDQGFVSPLALDSLNGSNGFVLNGITDTTVLRGDFVSGGADMNGDGLDDLIIASSYSESLDGGAYVLFGFDNPLISARDVTNLGGVGGFSVFGTNGFGGFGTSVSIGDDVNNDGFADLIIGESQAGNSFSGLSYVVFGGENFPANLTTNDLNGINGFTISGIEANDGAGRAVRIAGDINGDGIGDVIIGAYSADPGGRTTAGVSYVLFGAASVFSAINLAALDGSNGFAINGVDPVDVSGRGISGAGDVNGDGFDDVIVGAYAADPNGINAAGEAYVVFGQSDPFNAELNPDTFLPDEGFIISGIATNTYLGRSVSSAGDLNGDGFSDVILAAQRGNEQTNSSGAYVVFGTDQGFPDNLSVAQLTGNNGFSISGMDLSPTFGVGLIVVVSSAADVNGDGIDDVIIGTPYANLGAGTEGQSFVLFGNASPRALSAQASVNGQLEDNFAPSGTILAQALSSVFDDTEPFAGAAVVNHVADGADGQWEFSTNAGIAWNPMPASLSDENALVLSPTAQLRFVPTANFNGQPNGLSVRLWDGRWRTEGTGVDITSAVGALGGFANDANLLNLNVAISPVNDAPSFLAQDPPSVSSGSGPQTVSLWATFDPGADNETAQMASYQVTNISVPSLFASLPSIDSSGNLTYTPTPGNSGSTSFSVTVTDDGGAANGGQNTSPTQTFSLQIVGEQIFANGFES